VKRNGKVPSGKRDREKMSGPLEQHSDGAGERIKKDRGGVRKKEGRSEGKVQKGEDPFALHTAEEAL